MLHDAVIPVSVNPDGVVLILQDVGERPVKHFPCDISPRSRGCKAMDDIVRAVVRPFTFNIIVGRLGTLYQCHSAKDGIVITNDITIPRFDILTDNFLRGVSVIPLMEIPTLAHYSFGAFENLLQQLYVRI